MARVEIGETVLDQRGRPASSRLVYVNNRLTGAQATVYTAATGSTTRSQPLTTTTAGQIDGWVEEGSYDLVSGSVTTKYEAVSGQHAGALNVLSYGAVGDNSTDSTAAFQAALAAADGTETTRRAVLVPPGVYLIGPIVVPEFVTLQGAGVGLTVLRQKAGVSSNAWLVTQDTPSLTCVRDLTIDGNDLGTNVGGLDFAGDWSCAENVMVQRMSGTGVRLHNYSGNSLVNVNSWENAGHGFDLGPDCTVTNCQAATNGKDGFYLQGNSQLSNCKAFWNGYHGGAVVAANITAGLGNGFHWKAGSTYSSSTGLSAQDNAAAGFKLDGAYSVSVTGFIADSNNNRTGGTSCNIELTNGAGNNMLTGGQSVDRGANSPNTPTAGIAIGGSCEDNTIQIRTAGLSGKKIDSYTAGNIYRNELVVDGSRAASQGVAYAATYAPDPTLGNMIDIGALTGNITIPNPIYVTTDPVTLLFLQDGTGGRTITWGANIATAWQPASGASARSGITLRYDADTGKWRPLGSHGGTF